MLHVAPTTLQRMLTMLTHMRQLPNTMTKPGFNQRRRQPLGRTLHPLNLVVLLLLLINPLHMVAPIIAN
jgi:hypothetical protein